MMGSIWLFYQEKKEEEMILALSLMSKQAISITWKTDEEGLNVML